MVKGRSKANASSLNQFLPKNTFFLKWNRLLVQFISWLANACVTYRNDYNGS